MKDDHELFNQHLGCWNRSANDEKDAKDKETEENKAKASDDVSDLDRRFRDGIKGFKLLLGEFECVGDSENFNEHVISRGAGFGNTTYKQEWSKFVCIVLCLYIALPISTSQIPYYYIHRT